MEPGKKGLGIHQGKIQGLGFKVYDEAGSLRFRDTIMGGIWVAQALAIRIS